MPPPVARGIGLLRGLRPISFAIPAEHVVDTIPEKTQQFPTHVVDPEVAERLGAQTTYAFEDEAEYFADLRRSRFGVTTKRAGWDCMRHYELAASGTIPCFRRLDKKPKSCAPHGLVPGENCISYRDADDLMRQVEALGEREQLQLAEGAIAWARANTTVERAKQLLADCGTPLVSD